MMLQGHFVDTMLHPDFRKAEYGFYYVWEFMRGMTAPIFFFTTGLIFVFLLLKQSPNPYANKRVKKGLRRGIYIIFIGYLLHLNFFAVLALQYSNWYIAVDVLHCIGLAIIAIIGLFFLSWHTRIPLTGLLLGMGLLIFYVSPIIERMAWGHLPIFFEQYMDKEHGSIFTPIPWFGFTFLGGVMGAFLHHRPKAAFQWYFPICLAVLGFSLHYYSWHLLVGLHELTGWQPFLDLSNNNYLLWRLGHVFIVTSVIIFLCNLVKEVPSLLTKIGSETLAIYSVHYIILYGSWFGIGLAQFWRASLSPIPCIIGAISFIIAFVFMVNYLDIIRRFRDKKIKVFLHQQYLFLKNKIQQLYLRFHLKRR